MSDKLTESKVLEIATQFLLGKRTWLNMPDTNGGYKLFPVPNAEVSSYEQFGSNKVAETEVIELFENDACLNQQAVSKLLTTIADLRLNPEKMLTTLKVPVIILGQNALKLANLAEADGLSPQEMVEHLINAEYLRRMESV